VPRALPPVFRAFVATIVPEATALEESDWRQVEELVGNMLRQRPAGLVRQIRLLLGLIEWLPVLRHGRRFSSLDAAQRTRVLAGLQDHPVSLIRAGFWGLRTLALLGYYGRPEAARAIGYAATAQGWEAVR
jgi:hypothetical protein